MARWWRRQYGENEKENSAASQIAHRDGAAWLSCGCTRSSCFSRSRIKHQDGGRG